MITACIYKITSPCGNIYIGQTINFTRRVYAYRSGYKKGKSHIINSILKYGFDAHKIEVIYQLPVDVSTQVIDSYEIFCINQYKESGASMLNLRDGGGMGIIQKKLKLG